MNKNNFYQQSFQLTSQRFSNSAQMAPQQTCRELNAPQRMQKHLPTYVTMKRSLEKHAALV